MGDHTTSNDDIRVNVGLYLSRGAAVVAAGCAGVPGVAVEAFADVAGLLTGLNRFDALITQNTAYDAAFARRVTAAERLRWIQAAASGTDAFQHYGLPASVALTNAGDTWAPCVADHAMALLLALARGIPLAERHRQARRWEQQRVGDGMIGLRGRRLLVVGLGAIGRGVARRAAAFGMVVDAVTRSPGTVNDAPYLDHVDGLDHLHGRLAEADAVILSLPLTPESTGLLGRAALAAIKPSALLVNVSRGGVIDEAALLEALQAGRLAGVGLDVACTEPLPADSPLWSYERVCITPHVASYDDGPGFDLLAALCRDNVTRFRDGKPLRNLVGPAGRPAPPQKRDYGAKPRTLAELAVWQAGRCEEVLEPDLPIIDAHHHLWIRPPQRYLACEFAADITSGHDVRATVFVECEAMYKPDGPAGLRSVGETEFASGVGAMALAGAFGGPLICAGIVGHVNLAGDRVAEALHAHLAAGGGRFRGVRNHANHAPGLTIGTRQAPPDVLRQDKFRNGFAQLAPLGLSYDSWQFFEQLPDLLDLARSFPDTRIVLNHAGGILGVGPYRRADYLEHWNSQIANLAACPNVVVKLGGLGMAICGFDHFDADAPVSSEQLAADWRPYVERCVTAFGTDRCLFESNFPADKQCASYLVLWNAFKRIAASWSPEEKADVFFRTAATTYRLGI